MLTEKDIRPIADELVARWEKNPDPNKDPNYPATAYDLAREYCNELLAAGDTEELIRASTPAETVDRYMALPTRGQTEGEGEG